MSSTQRPPRRRSARLAFDEEDTRPVKKSKTTDVGSSGIAKPMNGKKSGAVGKKAKTAYDENEDGFQFSRTRSKKATSKESAQEALPDKSAAAPVASTRQRKTAPANTGATDEMPAPRVRKSARLSADTEEVQASIRGRTPMRGDERPSRAERRSERPKTPVADDELHVEKKRGPTKIALPFADTPVISRNKEMRKNSGQGNLRSSNSMRGRRASSLIDSGTSNAMPHGEVPTAEFYKHISQDLPEPRRMQQLLSWCATRALPEKPTGTAKDVNAILAARVIQEELLKDFSKKSELSDWFNREDTAPTALLKKPNPRNTQNAGKLQELEREVKRLEEEKRTWAKVLSSLSSTLPDDDQTAPTTSSASVEDIKTSILDNPDEKAILSELLSQPNLIEPTTSRLVQATENLEFSIDNLADGVHKLEKLKESAEAMTKAILSNAATALEQRDKAALEKAGMEKVGVGDILRSLSRAG